MNKGSAIMRYPDKWGRGEWTAKSLEDAKIMAEDFVMPGSPFVNRNFF